MVRDLRARGQREAVCLLAGSATSAIGDGNNFVDDDAGATSDSDDSDDDDSVFSEDEEVSSAICTIL